VIGGAIEWRSKVKNVSQKKSVVEVPTYGERGRTVQYQDHFTITVLVKAGKTKNSQPKRNGRNPYGIYKTGMTIGEFLNFQGAWPLVPKAADLWWDSAPRRGEKSAIIKINRIPLKAVKAPAKKKAAPKKKALVKQAPAENPAPATPQEPALDRVAEHTSSQA